VCVHACVERRVRKIAQYVRSVMYVGLAQTIHTYVHLYGVCIVFLAGKSSNIRSYIYGVHIRCTYTVYIYGVHIRFWPALDTSLRLNLMQT